MDNEAVSLAVAAYTELYGPPTRIIHFSRAEPIFCECAVVAYIPDDAERLDPAGNVTLMGTAGFGSLELCVDFPCELGIEVRGVIGEDSVVRLAKALIDLAMLSLGNGKPFDDGQIISNLSLPVFSRFASAMLVDWDPVYGFRFPEPLPEIGLLRVVPLFPEEVAYLESSVDRRAAYRDLVNRGMDDMDPGRGPSV
ncbi:hypothetical protein ACFVUW_19300 [Streptomyces xiamenensis]|uniref:hypothetical protein n=1 Tax=Streptomyces xiamenensis TaxID=408015 RepID=UPI0036E57CEB